MNQKRALLWLFMQDKVAAHQEIERWKSQMTLVVAGCQISRARAINADFSEKKNPLFELLVETVTGTWRVKKSLMEFRHFSESLELAFPVEAGQRGHPRILPVCRVGNKVLIFWSSPKKKALKLRQAVDHFCRELLYLPPYISRARLVLNFFLPGNKDPFTESPLDHLGVNSSGLEQMSLGSFTLSSMSLLSYQGDSKASVLELCRVKIRYGEECVIVDYDPEGSFPIFLRSIIVKLNVKLDEVFITYLDKEGDWIDVLDKDDLNAAIILFGKTLVLYLQ